MARVVRKSETMQSRTLSAIDVAAGSEDCPWVNQSDATGAGICGFRGPDRGWQVFFPHSSSRGSWEVSLCDTAAIV